MAAVVGDIEISSDPNLVDMDHMGIYKWTIEEYSAFDDKRVIHSPTFEKGGHVWRLWLFPKGSVNATEGDMSIFLHYIKKDDVFNVGPIVHPKAKFSIKINNQSGGEDIHYEIYDFHDFGESNGEWGWKDFAPINRLFEEDSGLIVEDRLQVELNIFVMPRHKTFGIEETSADAKTVVINVQTDAQMKREVGTLVFSGLPTFAEGKSYCFYDHMPFTQFEKLVSRDLRINLEDLRFWLCDQLPRGHIRFLKNLRNVQSPLESIGSLLDLKKDWIPSMDGSDVPENVCIYVEMPNEEESVAEIDEKEDFLIFCKYYDPWKMEISYLGTIPLRKDSRPAEIIVDARMLAGMDATATVSVFVEAPPTHNIVEELRSEDRLDTVGVRPGGSIIIQPKVSLAYAKKEGLSHPTVKTFLLNTDRTQCRSPSSESSHASHVRTEPHDEVCVICLSRPRTIGFLHGDSLHRCVCRSCAPQVIKDDLGKCPLCRKRIERVILNMF